MAHSKRVKAIRAEMEHGRVYALAEATPLVKKHATAKFDETVELSFFLAFRAEIKYKAAHRVEHFNKMISRIGHDEIIVAIHRYGRRTVETLHFFVGGAEFI